MEGEAPREQGFDIRIGAEGGCSWSQKGGGSCIHGRGLAGNGGRGAAGVRAARAFVVSKHEVVWVNNVKGKII